ncbi:lipoyl(octanoyl) transferase LipB [Buchnera aphidicola (Aphis helianthi)]|uniref:Octanoyltransferase n=1 Tax=Buchnera aphidicola (Aphis helianthi) TaxID=2315802 RepID=A0A4D6XNM2_9GAMM|nr:lipoyl(octanoyl) transferase LipB [Buchnera aphidicola]QCI17089.1 lipoyl(octanoyl) transferase LipB [Buchnera aphidicola (Aphis helianthi)]
MKNKIIFFKNIGLTDWIKVANKMNYFTEHRDSFTFDEIWFVEHYPIFTQGLLKKNYSIISKNNFINNIPVVNTDRGGQITYHGPGQQILYFLIDLRRRKINIRQLIDIIHILIIDTLNYFSIKSNIKKKFPGIYVNKKKICSLGLRIKKGCTMHGLSLNVNMDLTPFNYIYPCGDIYITMTQIKEFNSVLTLEDIRIVLIKKLSQLLNVKIIKKSYFLENI